MNTQRLVGKFVYVKCICGDHLIDLYDEKWNDKKLGFYHCNSCNAPIICRGDDGHFYNIGSRIE